MTLFHQTRNLEEAEEVVADVVVEVQEEEDLEGVPPEALLIATTEEIALVQQALYEEAEVEQEVAHTIDQEISLINGNMTCMMELVLADVMVAPKED